MRFFLLFILAFILGTAVQAQSSRKSTQQAFVTDNINRIRFNIDPNNIEVKTTRGTRLIIEINVAINSSMTLLDYAIGTGRYNVEQVVEGDVMTINPSERKQAIMIRGQEIQEEITYTIYMPEHLEQKNTATSAEK